MSSTICHDIIPASCLLVTNSKAVLLNIALKPSLRSAAIDLNCYVHKKIRISMAVEEGV